MPTLDSATTPACDFDATCVRCSPCRAPFALLAGEPLSLSSRQRVQRRRGCLPLVSKRNVAKAAVPAFGSELDG